MTNWIVNRFVKHPERTDDVATRASYGKTAGIAGIVCNCLLFLSKLIIGLLARSISITADAFNNLSDVASSVIALVGFRVAAKPPDEEHPFGHARFEYISGLAVAGLILVVGFQFAKSSIEKILHPEPVAFSIALLITLLLSIALKLWLSRFYRTIGERISSTSLKATSKDSRNDVITTAAVLAAMLVEKYTGFQIDGFAGLVVAAIILISCVQIARETVSPLLGETADPELVRRIATRISTYDNRVMGIHDLMVHDYGPGQRFATVHLEVDAKEDVMRTHDLIDDLEHLIFQEEGVQLLIHHDPVVTDDPEQNHLRRMVKKTLRQIDERLQMHDFRLDRRGACATVTFDMVVPPDLVRDEEEIRKRIRQILDREETKYELVITFDTQSFNRYLKEGGE